MELFLMNDSQMYHNQWI